MDTLREILKDCNADVQKLKLHMNNKYFVNFMVAAYIKKIDLPEGMPPYKSLNIESDIQTKGIMWQFLKKLDVFYNPKLNQLKREVMFIDAIENVSKNEALVLEAMKDQTLYKIYPNLTLEAVKPFIPNK